MEHCLSKECVEDYLDKLEASISEYMSMPIASRSSEAVESMVRCWEMVYGLSEKLEEATTESELTEEDAQEWCHYMKNADGTNGAHWSVRETANIGRPNDMPEWMWNAAMNMMYSDYINVASKYGVNTVTFYADLAKAFLNDADAQEDKLAKYYHHIVEKF